MAEPPVVPTGIDVGATAVAPSRRRWLRRLRRNPLSIAALAVVVALLLTSVLAGVLAPYGYAAVNLAHRLEPPSLTFPLGTDQFGRDVLSRVLYGSQASLFIALSSTFVGSLIGVILGALAGYVGGWIDELVMRGMDILLAFPSIILGIALAAVFGPSLINLGIIIGLLQVPNFARVTRSTVVSIKPRDFVTATKSLGQSELAIVLRHVLPNTARPLVVLASLTVPGAIVAEAGLSFLGLGVQPPTPSWGNLVFEGTRYVLRYPWLAAFPAVVITVAVIAFNILGDGLRDALDPRSSR